VSCDAIFFQVMRNGSAVWPKTLTTSPTETTMSSPDHDQPPANVIPFRPSKYREVGEGPFGCVTVDHHDGSVLVRRFRTHREAVVAMMRGSSGAAGRSPRPVASRPLDDPDAA
jgi:hypothetical protein